MGNMSSEEIKELSDTYQLHNQTNYIINLPDMAKKMLRDYTGYLDKYVNVLLSTNYYNIEGSELEFKLAKHTIRVIDRLFEKVPKTTKEMVVYRGAKNIYTGPYISTSLKEVVALSFVRKIENLCCLYKIIIPEGSSILPMFVLSKHYTEYEILLDRKGILNQTGKECKVDVGDHTFDCIELIYHS
jgi:hypothetical protein